MGVLVLLACAVLAVALPDAMPSWPALDRHAPDLFAALAVWLGTRGQGYGVVGWAAFLGAIADSTSLEPLGSRAFALAFVAFLFVRRRGGPPARGPALAVAIATGTWLVQAVGLLRTLPLHRDAAPWAGMLEAVPTALWTTAVAWPLLALLDRTRALDDLLGRRGGLSA